MSFPNMYSPHSSHNRLTPVSHPEYPKEPRSFHRKVKPQLDEPQSSEKQFMRPVKPPPLRPTNRPVSNPHHQSSPASSQVRRHTKVPNYDRDPFGLNKSVPAAMLKPDQERLLEEGLSLKMEVNTYKAENLRLRTRANQLEREITKRDEELDDLRSKAGEKHYHAALQQAHLVSGLKQTVKDLKADLKTKDETLQAVKRSLKYTQIAELEMEIETYANECSRLKSVLMQSAAKPPQSRESLGGLDQAQGQVISRLNKEKLALEKTVQSLQEKTTRLELRLKASEKQTEADHLTLEMEKVREDLSSKVRTLTQAEERIRQQSATIRSLEEDLKAVNREREDLKADNADLKESIEDLRRQVKTCEEREAQTALRFLVHKLAAKGKAFAQLLATIKARNLGFVELAKSVELEGVVVPGVYWEAVTKFYMGENGDIDFPLLQKDAEAIEGSLPPHETADTVDLPVPKLNIESKEDSEAAVNRLPASNRSASHRRYQSASESSDRVFQPESSQPQASKPEASDYEDYEEQFEEEESSHPPQQPQFESSSSSDDAEEAFPAPVAEAQRPSNSESRSGDSGDLRQEEVFTQSQPVQSVLPATGEEAAEQPYGFHSPSSESAQSTPRSKPPSESALPIYENHDVDPLSERLSSFPSEDRIACVDYEIERSPRQAEFPIEEPQFFDQPLPQCPKEDSQSPTEPPREEPTAPAEEVDYSPALYAHEDSHVDSEPREAEDALKPQEEAQFLPSPEPVESVEERKESESLRELSPLESSRDLQPAATELTAKEQPAAEERESKFPAPLSESAVPDSPHAAKQETAAPEASEPITALDPHAQRSYEEEMEPQAASTDSIPRVPSPDEESSNLEEQTPAQVAPVAEEAVEPSTPPQEEVKLAAFTFEESPSKSHANSPEKFAEPLPDPVKSKKPWGEQLPPLVFGRKAPEPPKEEPIPPAALEELQSPSSPIHGAPETHVAPDIDPAADLPPRGDSPSAHSSGSSASNDSQAEVDLSAVAALLQSRVSSFPASELQAYLEASVSDKDPEEAVADLALCLMDAPFSLDEDMSTRVADWLWTQARGQAWLVPDLMGELVGGWGEDAGTQGNVQSVESESERLEARIREQLRLIAHALNSRGQTARQAFEGYAGTVSAADFLHGLRILGVPDLPRDEFELMVLSLSGNDSGEIRVEELERVLEKYGVEVGDATDCVVSEEKPPSEEYPSVPEEQKAPSEEYPPEEQKAPSEEHPPEEQKVPLEEYPSVPEEQKVPPAPLPPPASLPVQTAEKPPATSSRQSIGVLSPTSSIRVANNPLSGSGSVVEHLQDLGLRSPVSEFQANEVMDSAGVDESGGTEYEYLGEREKQSPRK